jgi:hypothetical protein
MNDNDEYGNYSNYLYWMMISSISFSGFIGLSMLKEYIELKYSKMKKQ